MESYKKGLVRRLVPSSCHCKPQVNFRRAILRPLTLFLFPFPPLPPDGTQQQEIEPNNQLCTQGLQKTVQRIRDASSQEVDMERAAHGMADPEVQAILTVSKEGRGSAGVGWLSVRSINPTHTSIS